MKLANKISLSIFLVTMLCTAGACLGLYLLTRRSLENEIKAHMVSMAQSRTDHVTTYLAMLKSSVAQLAIRVKLENFLKTSAAGQDQQGIAFEDAIVSLSRAKGASPALDDFLLLDKTGKVIAGTDKRDIGADKSADAYFLGGRDKVYIKDVYYSETAQEPTLAVSAPILDSQTGEFLGVIVARLTLKDMNAICEQRAGLGKSGEMVIVNKDRLMISPSRFLKNTCLKQKVDTEGVRQAFLYKDNRFVPNIYNDYRGVSVLGAHGYIPEMQWAVSTKINAQEAFAPLVAILRVFIILLLAIPLIAWLIGALVARSIIRALTILHQGAEIIGSGNLDYKVGTDANDEVGQLSRAFDAMTENLKTTTTSLVNLNNEIAERKRTEEQLRARTAELFEREEDLAITLRSIGDAMIATDTEGRVTRMNPVAEHLTGWSLAEASGKPLEDVFRIINAQTRAPVANPIAKVLVDGQVVGLANHTALIARDGTVRQIADSAAPIRDAGGRIRGVVLVFHDVTAEYHIKEVLQKQTEELESFFHISLDLLCIADLEGNFIKVNKAWEDILGYPITELEQRKFLEFVHPEDMQATLDAMAKLGEGKHVLNLTNRYKCKDGSYKFIEWRSAPHGNLIYAAARDITERKRVEDELRKRSQAVEQSPAIVVITDLAGNTEYVNPKFTQATGYTLTDMLGKNLRILKSGELSSATYKELWETITSGREWRGEFHNKKKDGTLYWESALIAPVTDANRRITHFLAIKEDITERKQAEACCEMGREILQILNEPGDLRDSIQRVIAALKARTGFDALGIRLQDGEDFPYIAQQGFPKDFLLTENTLIGRAADGGVCRDKDGNPRLECTCGLVISGKTDPANPLFTKGGSCWTNDSFPLLDIPPGEDPRLHPRNECIHQGYASVALVPIRNKDRIIGLIQLNDRRKGRFTLNTVELLEGIASHIGAALMRKQAEEALREAQTGLEEKVAERTRELKEAQERIVRSEKLAIVGQLASSVAHELRNPLGVIKNAVYYLNVLELGKANPDIKENMDIISAEIENSDKVISDLLEFSRIKQPALRPEEINLIIKETLNRVTVPAGIKMVTELGAHLPPIQLDALQMQLVFYNLAVNAIQAMEKGGTLAISTRKQSAENGEQIEIAFRDTGIGIPKENLAKILEPLFSTKTKGTGLGLSVVASLVEGHGGKIVIESEVGKGSIFTVKLPVK